MSQLGRILHLLNLPCREVAELISRGMDQELPRAERCAVRLHLLYCTMCRRWRRQLLHLREVMRGLEQRVEQPDFTPPVPLGGDARQRIRDTLGDR